MSKDKISDYSATANSNTDIAGINIDEGCAPSGINNAIRTLMKQLKDWQSGSQDVYVTPAGSVSAPAVTTTGDTNTGVYFPAADKVAIATGGTQAVIVDSSQNVGIGTSSPTQKLDVAGSGATRFIVRDTSSTGIARVVASGADAYVGNSSATGNLVFQTVDAEAMRIDSSGNVGIGTSSPDAKLTLKNPSVTGEQTVFDVHAATNTTKLFYTSVNQTTDVVNTGTGYYAPLAFITNSTERARITAGGDLLVGKTASSSSTVGFQVISDGTIYSTLAASTAGTNTNLVYSTGASAYRFYVGMEGKVYCTSTTITGISDQRLKENIRDLDDGLDKVMALKPRKFDWKEGKGQNTKDARGFIAQEFETVFPDMIDEWLDDAPEGEEPYKAVNANLIPTLVKAIQEQQAMITSQSELINVQQAVLTTLTERITALENK